MNPSNEGCIYRNQVFFAKENPFSIGAIRSFLFEATLAGPVASCCTRAPNFTCYLHVREPIVLSLLFGWVRCCTHLLVINSHPPTLVIGSRLSSVVVVVVVLRLAFFNSYKAK